MLTEKISGHDEVMTPTEYLAVRDCVYAHRQSEISVSGLPDTEL